MCGLSTRKMLHALLDPEQHDVAQRLPQRDAVGAVEVRIDDVLVFLRRVLGVLDRAVGPPLEPFRMLLQPGMIRRALDREVERDLHAVARGRLRRSGGSRRACRAPDGPRRGRPPPRRWRRGCRDRRARAFSALLRPLRLVRADRMDRREIDDVEAERRDLRQPRDAVVERAVPARHRALAARDHLVPGAGARARPVGDQRDRDAAGQVAARVARGDGLRQVRPPAAASTSAVAVELALGAVDRSAWACAIVELQLVEQLAAFARLERDVEAGVALEHDVACARWRTGRSRPRSQNR